MGVGFSRQDVAWTQVVNFVRQWTGLWMPINYCWTDASVASMILCIVSWVEEQTGRNGMDVKLSRENVAKRT